MVAVFIDPPPIPLRCKHDAPPFAQHRYDAVDIPFSCRQLPVTSTLRALASTL